jgi:hypothetical protein
MKKKENMALLLLRNAAKCNWVFKIFFLPTKPLLGLSISDQQS